MAQSPADRTFLDSLFTLVGRDTTAAQLPSPDLCNGHDAVSLCQATLLTRRGELTQKKSNIADAHDLMDKAATEHPTWPMVWYILAATELAGDDVGVSARNGPLQVSSEGNAAAAERALLHALALDSTFARAATALAVAPISHDGHGFPSARVTALRKARALLPPASTFAAAQVEREAGHFDSAFAIGLRLLRQNSVPRGLVDITLAADLFATHNRDNAYTVYYGGANDTAHVSRRAYRDQLAWIATDSELKQWDATAPAARTAWLHRFWDLRDLRDGRPAGARLDEQFRRFAEVSAMYRFRYTHNTRPDTLRLVRLDYHVTDLAPTAQPFRSFWSADDVIDDRGSVYMRQGIPYLAMRSTGLGGLELWEYTRPGVPLYVSFSPFLAIGPPRQVGPFNGEILKKLDDPMYYVAPSTLIPTVADSADVYGYFAAHFCAMKASLCRSVPDSIDYSSPRINCAPAAPKPDISWRLGDPRFANRKEYRDPDKVAALDSFMTQPPPADWPYIRERETEEGFWEIDQALGTDLFAIPFTRPISPAFAAHVLRHSSGDHRLVVALQIPQKDLPHWQMDFSNAALSYPMHLHVAALRVSDGQRFDLDTTAIIQTASVVPVGGQLSAMIELPLAAGRYDASIWVMQLNDSSGVLVRLDSLLVARDDGQLRVSDVILGESTTQLQWQSGERSVAINPSNDVMRGATTAIFYQLSGIRPGTTYQTRFTFFRDEAGTLSRDPKLALTFSATAGTALENVSRSIDATTLEPGSYRIRVDVSGDGQQAESTGCMVVHK